MSNTSGQRPEADSISAAAKDIKDGIVNSAQYVKERVTAPASGETGTSTTTTTSAKLESQKTAGDKAVDVKEDTKGFFSKVGDSAKDKADEAGNKVEETKEDAKKKYEETQQTIADKLATDPIEESRAHGEIPADTATVESIKPTKS
jgi:ElaB/YqjD/DUF883 family membrane-anchored ribosome-binding protein